MFELVLGIVIACVAAAFLTGFSRGIADLKNGKAAPDGAEKSSGAGGAYPYEHEYTQDDIIYKDGHYCENENSEDWEEFEYEMSEDERFK